MVLAGKSAVKGITYRVPETQVPCETIAVCQTVPLNPAIASVLMLGGKSYRYFGME